MTLKVIKAGLEDILHFRLMFLAENNFQIRYNACHERGWSDSYILLDDYMKVGYGSVKGQEIKERDTVFEFYIIPSFRKFSNIFFRELLLTSAAELIESQSNELLLTAMLYEFSSDINSKVILFKDNLATNLTLPGVIFRKRKKEDFLPKQNVVPEGDYVLEKDGKVVASGGFLLHYNMPFADLYMEVGEDFRKKGFGSFLIQEIKKECYLAGRIPAARCNIENYGSRATLIKAGLSITGFMLLGKVNLTK